MVAGEKDGQEQWVRCVRYDTGGLELVEDEGLLCVAEAEKEGKGEAALRAVRDGEGEIHRYHALGWDAKGVACLVSDGCS